MSDRSFDFVSDDDIMSNHVILARDSGTGIIYELCHFQANRTDGGTLEFQHVLTIAIVSETQVIALIDRIAQLRGPLDQRTVELRETLRGNQDSDDNPGRQSA